MCATPVFHSRMKHVALDYQFIRGQVKSGHLRVVHVSTKDPLADAKTKPLSGTIFFSLSQARLEWPNPPPSLGAY